MKNAQLIKVTETVLYKNANGEVLVLTPTDKLLHALVSPELIVTYKTEEVMEKWFYKSKKEIDVMFYNYIETNNLDARNYYIVFA